MKDRINYLITNIKNLIFDKNGVTTTLDYILIFAISVLLLSSSVFVFRMHGDRVMEQNKMTQLELIGEHISTEILDIYLSGFRGGIVDAENGKGVIVRPIDLPPNAGKEPYSITLSNASVEVKSNDLSTSTNLNGIREDISISGNINSNEGYIIFDGSSIEISEQNPTS